MITKRDLPGFFLIGLLAGSFYFIADIYCFGHPLPFLKDRLWRLFISSVFPGISFAILGCWGTELHWPGIARKWLSIGFFGFGLSAFSVIVLNPYPLASISDLVKPVSIALVFTLFGWLMYRSFWELWRLVFLMAILLVHGVVCYQDSLIFWRPWSTSPAIISGTEKVELQPLTGHAYQFYVLAYIDDHIDVRINVNNEGSGSLTAKIYRRQHPKNTPDNTITEEYHVQLDRTQVTHFLDQIEKTRFWDLTVNDLEGMNYGEHIWLMNGVRDGQRQELRFRCPDLLSKLPPGQVEYALYDLGLLFLRSARVPYHKRSLIGESIGEGRKWYDPF